MTDTDLTPRQRRRRKRLQQLRSEAMAMIVEGGIQAFSVNKLADRVDLTPGALYRYFDSRDAILAAIQIEVLEHFDKFFEALQQRIDDRRGLRTLVILSIGYVALAQLQPERFRLISAFVADPEPILEDGLATQVVGPTLGVVQRFVSTVATAQNRGILSPGDPLARAALIWSSLQGFINHRKLTRLPQVPLDAEALLVELLRTLLTGWGADEVELADGFEDLPDLDYYRHIMEELR